MGPNRINKVGVQKQDIFVEMTKSWLTDFPIKFLESSQFFLFSLLILILNNSALKLLNPISIA